MKKAPAIFFCIIATAVIVKAQNPANDNCSNALQINPQNYCSATGEFNNVNATESFVGNGRDVWFKFTAVAFEVSINVTGNTLQSPRIGMMSDCEGAGIVGSTIIDGNTTIFTKGGLTPGVIYYVWISGANNNTGTFQLCSKNYNPPTKPGQDFPSASLLCSTASFPAINITGAGTNNHETAGTCMGSEANTAWYKWTAANSGTLVFTITPTKFDDIDWVLYDLGPEGNTQNPSAQNAIRCAAGHGINNRDCPNEPMYTKTGLDFNEQDINEAVGCGQKQNGVVRFVDMQKGHVYALIIDNVYEGNNGFSMDFTDRNGKAGTGTFVGPEANISMLNTKPCTIDQNFTFSANAANYTTLKWYFGEGANVESSNEPDPSPISYSTPGEKTVVLQVISDRGCSIATSKSFIVGLKPDLPIINGLKSKYCFGETISLSTPRQNAAIYSWTGPGGFTSDQPEINIPIDNDGKAGTYTLNITIYGCTSDPASVVIPPIGQTPVASFTNTLANPCTAQQTYTFTNTSTNYQKIRWNFGDGANIQAGGGNNIYTVSYATSGIKTITLEAEGSSGCLGISRQDLTVALSPARPVISSNKPDFCLSDTIRLSTPIQTDAIYHWTGPNNFTSDQRSVEIPVNSIAVAGTYTLVISRGSCSTEAVNVTIPPIFKNPIAAFRAEPKIPSRLAIPIRVRFFNESKDADAYLWNFGDGQTSTEENPEHIYLSAGNFDVTLTVFKSSVCSASVLHGQFIISADNILFIPNTFTPNNDAVNDEFVVSMTNINIYRIQIFNRYGVSMFISHDIFNNWKGTYKNELVPVGTYYYLINATDYNDNVIKKSGSVTILR